MKTFSSCQHLTLNMGAEVLKLGVSRARNSAASQALRAGALSCSNMQMSNYPQRHINAIALRYFCGCNCKTSRNCHQQTTLSLPSKQGSKWPTSWDKQACTHDTLWCQRYVTTSKEYLINCYILLKYFELVFFHLQEVKILCQLILIWMNYERKKKKCIFMKHRVYRHFSKQIVVAIFNATFIPFCKQLIEECDTIERFYRIAMFSECSRTRLLLQILLQNPFVNGQNGHSLVGWLTSACTYWYLWRPPALDGSD